MTNDIIFFITYEKYNEIIFDSIEFSHVERNFV